MSTDSLDPKAFKRILNRNVALPLLLCSILSCVFIGLVLFLGSVSRWVDHTDQVISKANLLLKLIVDSETSLRGFLLTNHDAHLGPLQIARDSLPKEFQELELLVSDNPPQVLRAQKLSQLYKLWGDLAAETVAEKAKDPKGALVSGIDLRKQQMDQIRAGFQDFINIEETLRSQRAESTTSTTHLIILLTIILSAIIGIIVAITGRKQLVALSENYEGALNSQREQNEILNAQAWLRSGQAELSESIMGELAVSELSARVLHYLVQRLEAKVGSFYTSQSTEYLMRQASYAISSADDANMPERLKRGEGLVGQAVLDRKPIYLNDIPDNYVRINSSLGSARPKYLMVFPFINDGAVNSVIELGFMEVPSQRAVDFVKAAAEIIATAVKSAAYRSRLQDLLHESQQLTEELQTQQEELKTSNEELAEQTNALQEAQARLESQHAELEQTNEQLEEQTQTLELQKRSLDTQNLRLIDARSVVEEKARELQAANQYKSEFLANMSHELRTPLNSTLILAKLLKDNPQGNLSNEQVEFASTIYGAGNDLLDLINDILDLSKVEAGKLDLHLEKIEIPNLVGNLRKIFKPVADDKSLNFEIRLETGPQQIIETDQQRVEQILKNLLSNAMKFTAAGSVQLVVSNRPDGHLAFAVTDTGVGISADQQNIIFEAFRQADGTINRKYGGTGLGLTISRNLATLLGGTIEVKSGIDQGSTFTLILPATYLTPVRAQDTATAENAKATTARIPEIPAPVAPKKTKAGEAPFEDDRHREATPGMRTLLIVEDDLEFSRILFELAHELGFRALVANNTADAYILTTEHFPQAIILDMKLPDALGLSLLDRLKQNPLTRHIPVHVVSGADYSREARYLGAAGYAFKPANRQELKETFRTLEEKINQQIKRVLLVEDDEVQRMSIQKLIGGDKGVEIVSVTLGQEALEKLKAVTFDCMVIDLTLPDMSGFELLDKMAQGQDFAFPPVIVYTGRSLSKAEEEKLRKYSRTIIIKGARSPERLLDEVTLFLHQVESKMTPERQRMLKESRSREKAFEGRKIMLVDDDVRNIFALTAALEQRGAKIRIARNGRECLDQLNSDPELDLVLMDIMMPEMDGYQAMREIRKKPEFAKLPIIAVTAKAMKDDYEKCLEAGANDYLAKPIDVDKLVSLMRVWLPKPLGRD